MSGGRYELWSSRSRMREEKIPRARGVAETHHYSSQVESFKADRRPSPRVTPQSHVGTLEIPRQSGRLHQTDPSIGTVAESNECG